MSVSSRAHIDAVPVTLVDAEAAAVGDWIEANLGQPYRLTDEERMFLQRFYELRPGATVRG